MKVLCEGNGAPLLSMYVTGEGKEIRKQSLNNLENVVFHWRNATKYIYFTGISGNTPLNNLKENTGRTVENSTVVYISQVSVITFTKGEINFSKVNCPNLCNYFCVVSSYFTLPHLRNKISTILKYAYPALNLTLLERLNKT